jgi:hypothetical protein
MLTKYTVSQFRKVHGEYWATIQCFEDENGDPILTMRMKSTYAKGLSNKIDQIYTQMCDNAEPKEQPIDVY